MTMTPRYESRREPVLARNVVATSQPLAAQAGLNAMRAGGNAVDAAIAAAACLTVVEPTANGLGGDAFAIVSVDGQLHGLNASGKSPRLLHRDNFPDGRIEPLGWQAVTVPGAVSAWVDLSQRFGRLPFDTLLEAAIDYARSGFPVSPQTAAGWARAQVRYADFPEWQRVFAPAGQAPAVGEIFRNPDQARTIELIATSKGEAFYQGELAQRMASVSARDGGVLSLKDLSEHTPIEAAPLNVTLGGAQVHELPPNGQGLAALVAMGIVERLDLVGADPDDPATIHLHIEAMKIGFEDAFRIVADPDHLIEDPALVLSDAALSARADAIDADTGRDVVFPWPQWSSTVYLATADSDGNAVSFIQSNFEGFGSGVVIDGTGIAMQNRATGFLPQADHPGTIQGGHRPFHTIIPGFITRNGATDMAFGVMGGPMQAQGHLQVATRCLLAGQNPQEALDAPRWRIFDERRVEVEPGTSQSIIDGLTQRGHRIVEAESRTVRFGGGQAVQRRGECWLAASDSRRDGQAVGF